MDILSPQKHFNPMLKVKMEWYNDIRGRRGLMGRRGRRVVKIEGNSFFTKISVSLY